MKYIKEKFKRTVKYWRVSYIQASGQDRFNLALFGLMMLAYVWWVIVVY